MPLNGNTIINAIRNMRNWWRQRRERRNRHIEHRIPDRSNIEESPQILTQIMTLLMQTDVNNLINRIETTARMIKELINVDDRTSTILAIQYLYYLYQIGEEFDTSEIYKIDNIDVFKKSIEALSIHINMLEVSTLDSESFQTLTCDVCYTEIEQDNISGLKYICNFACHNTHTACIQCAVNILSIKDDINMPKKQCHMCRQPVNVIHVKSYHEIIYAYNIKN